MFSLPAGRALPPSCADAILCVFGAWVQLYLCLMLWEVPDPGAE